MRKAYVYDRELGEKEMLSQLIISNIAVISKCEMTLSGGFNVLTGETGAGKSLIIDSINLVLGERGNRELIRHGEKKAKVEALFYLTDEEKEMLQNEVGEFDGNDFLISREIFEDGRNVCKVNGEMATVARLRDIARHLVNIHGQNDGQKLLMKSGHIDYVDKFAENDELISEYKSLYGECAKIRKELEGLQNDEGEKLRRLDSVRFWLQEIESAELYEGEDEELSEKHKIIKNAEKLRMSVSTANDLIYSGEQNAYSYISGAVRSLTEAASYDSGLSEKLDELSEVLYRLEDIGRELSYYGNDMDFDMGEILAIEERLHLLQKLKSKYGNTIEEILKYADTLREEVETIEFSGEREKELRAQLSEKEALMQGVADTLSEKRKDAAEKITLGVMEELKFLDMEKVTFGIKVEKGEMGTSGQDKVEFLVSTNPAEPLKALTSVASGGEMSRICLAIKTVLAGADEVGTLIFDEIDTGVSGKAAGKIASKLRTLGETGQVICITHLPQIASKAQSHYLIEKNFEGNTFSTDVKLLGDAERVLEVARIISGDDISESAKKAAEEMIKNI